MITICYTTNGYSHPDIRTARNSLRIRTYEQPRFSRIGPPVSHLSTTLTEGPKHKPFRIRTYKKRGGGYPIAIFLEVKFQRQLDLPRVKHRSRRRVKWVRRPFQIVRCASTAKRRWIGWTEIRRSVDRVEEPDVRCIEQVKRLRDHLKAPLLVK